MRKMFGMIFGTLAVFVVVSEPGIMIVKHYTGTADELWFYRMAAMYYIGGLVASPIPYLIGSDFLKNKNSYWAKIGKLVSMIVFIFCLVDLLLVINI